MALALALVAMAADIAAAAELVPAVELEPDIAVAELVSVELVPVELVPVALEVMLVLRTGYLTPRMVQMMG